MLPAAAASRHEVSAPSAKRIVSSTIEGNYPKVTNGRSTRKASGLAVALEAYWPPVRRLRIGCSAEMTVRTAQ
jgi:hypothetical protein